MNLYGNPCCDGSHDELKEGHRELTEKFSCRKRRDLGHRGEVFVRSRTKKRETLAVRRQAMPSHALLRDASPFQKTTEGLLQG